MFPVFKFSKIFHRSHLIITIVIHSDITVRNWFVLFASKRLLHKKTNLCSRQLTFIVEIERPYFVTSFFRDAIFTLSTIERVDEESISGFHHQLGYKRFYQSIRKHKFLHDLKINKLFNLKNLILNNLIFFNTHGTFFSSADTEYSSLPKVLSYVCSYSQQRFAITSDILIVIVIFPSTLLHRLPG